MIWGVQKIKQTLKANKKHKSPSYRDSQTRPHKPQPAPNQFPTRVDPLYFIESHYWAFCETRDNFQPRVQTWPPYNFLLIIPDNRKAATATLIGPLVWCLLFCQIEWKVVLWDRGWSLVVPEWILMDINKFSFVFPKYFEDFVGFFGAVGPRSSRWLSCSLCFVGCF